MQNEAMETGPSFLCLIEFGDGTSPVDGGSNQAVPMSLGSFPVQIASKSFHAGLRVQGKGKLASAEGGAIKLLLWGEAYGCGTEDQASYLMDRYLARGLDFAGELNGSFAILILDARADTAAVVTDRLGSRKIFHSSSGNRHWLFSSIYGQPAPSKDLDIAGVASYLANGAVLNDRTLLAGVRRLTRACVHRFEREGVRSVAYWEYEFNEAYAGRPRVHLQDELAEILIGSVRLRRSTGEEIWLSLSAGLDSRPILGILGNQIGVSSVRCFSYVLGKAQRESDAYISSRMAASLGFPFAFVKSYDGDLPKVLQRNAEWGQGVANFCDEADAWGEMSEEFLAAGEKAALFVGDTPLRFSYRKLGSTRDALYANAITDFRVLDWTEQLFGRSAYQDLRDALDGEINRVESRCPQPENLHNAVDYYHLDQGLNSIVLPWRESFAGRCVNVRNPWLDNSLIDFVCKLPSPLRVKGMLWQPTVEKLCPGLFRFPLARGLHYGADWSQELFRQREEIERLSSGPSRLDGVVPPELVKQLLDALHPRASHSRLAHQGMQLAGGAWSRFKVPFVSEPKDPDIGRPLDPINISADVLLKRVLVLRLFLEGLERARP